MHDHEFGKPSEWESMDAGAEALLNRSYRAFDFADVTVSGDNVHRYGMNFASDTLKFVVRMNVANSETSGLIEVDYGRDLAENSFVCAVGDGDDGPIANTPRDGV